MPAHPEFPIEEFPVVISLPIQWGEQDAFGHVNNIVYLRWVESGRIAYGERVGLTVLFSKSRIGPILAAATCNYRRQLQYPDSVRIGTRVTRLGRTSLIMRHTIISEKLGGVAADAESTVVVFDYATNRPTPIPAELRAAVAALETSPVEGL